MEEKEEKKHKRIGWMSSIGTSLVLLILFYFLIAWKEPFPPIPSYGVELSFGIEDQGRGEQPVTSPQESVEQPTESQEEAVEEVIEEPAEESLEEPIEAETEPATDVNSPVKVEETKTKSESPKQNDSKQEAEPTKQQTEVKQETKEINQNALMESDKSNESKGTTTQEGNEGKEEGTIDGRALMGSQGGTTGASLNMSGWTWDSKPNPKDDSDESGKIVYRVRIDDSGYVIGLELVSSTVSPVVERYYRQSIEKLTFSQTTNTPAPPTSSGTISFIIRSK